MKIGVLTHSGTDDNYGQILQCYALQVYLKQLGHDVFLIKYSSSTEKQERLHFIKQIVRNLISIINPSRKKKYEELKHYELLRKENSEKNKQRKFKDFIYKNIKVSRTYNTYKDLITDPPIADVYIVGSDQVWNIDLSKPFSAAWYLQFGQRKIRRISYAASIGRSINEHERDLFVSYLNQFDAISVREQAALEYCHQIGLTNVKLVLDPTLLVPPNIYKPFMKEISEKPYVFLYYLNVNRVDELNWVSLNKYLHKNDFGLKTVSSSGYLPASDLIPGHTNQLLTIPEWLTSIYNATFVVTTSFHGIIFSIIMHRPFVAIPLKNDHNSANNRIYSLLKHLGLENRMLDGNKTFDCILGQTINWTEVDSVVAKLRTHSQRFLIDALV